MRVNFNRTFKDYRGNDLLVNGQPQIMGHIVAQCLFNGEGAKPSGNPMKDNTRKLISYTLCNRIMQAEGPISLTVEEAVIVKEAVQSLTPGCYAQIVLLIEPLEQ